MTNQGWRSCKRLLQNTLDECVGEQMYQRLNQLAELARTKPNLISVSKRGENENDEVAQYSEKSIKLLGAKMAQLSKRSRFLVTISTPQTEDQKRLDDRGKDLPKQRGITTEQDTPSNS